MRGSAARVLLPALVVLALVAVVAIAATGSTSTGTTSTRPPSATLLDTILSLGFVAVLVGAVLLAYGLTQRKAIAREVASGKYKRVGFVSYATFLLLFAVVTYFRLRDWERPLPAELQEPVLAGGQTPTPTNPQGAGADSVYEPQFAWIPVLAVVVLAAAGAFAYYLATRQRANALGVGADVADTLADVLDDTLDDLRAEADPRRAVIGAYARLERVLAAHGFPRRTSETQEEYVGRILDEFEVDRRFVRRLTELFLRAKFSQHAVDTGMKEEAIEALEQVRDELREAATAREEAPGVKLVVTETSS
jgi:hypothetical protein